MQVWKHKNFPKYNQIFIDLAQYNHLSAQQTKKKKTCFTNLFYGEIFVTDCETGRKLRDLRGLIECNYVSRCLGKLLKERKQVFRAVTNCVKCDAILLSALL